MKVLISILLLSTALVSCRNSTESTKSVVPIVPEIKSQYEADMFFWNKHLDSIDLRTISRLDWQFYAIEELPTEILDMRSLKYLSISPFLEGKSVLEEIGDLSNLDTLILSKSKIDSLPASIGKLNNLKYLLVAGGGQLKSVPIEIGNCTELVEINFWRNSLKTLPEEFQKLKKLERLILHENDFSETERTRIKRLLPNCKIQFDY